MSFYKVTVYSLGGELLSPLVRHQRLLVRYRVGEWAYPPYPGLPLTAYSNIIPARILALSLPFSDVYRCEVKNPRPITLVPRPDLTSQPEQKLRKLWAEILDGTAKDRYPFTPADPFVMVCDALRLTEMLPHDAREWVH